MAYRRRYNYKRRPSYGRRRKATAWYNKKYSAVQLASKAWKGVNYLKGLVNSEKYVNDNVDSTTFSSSGTVVSLCDIAQGDTETTRTGNSIFVRSVSVRAHCIINAAATSTVCRLVLFTDRQQIADTNPTMGDVFQQNGSVTAPFTFLDQVNRGRFTILAQKMCVLNANRPSALVSVSRILRHHVRYNGTLAADIQKGTIYFGFICNESTNTPTIQYDSRLMYHDN